MLMPIATVFTSHAGRPFFTLAAAAISMRDKRQLLDAYNQPLVQMEQKMLSLHSTWLMVDPRSGRKLAEVKPALMSLTPCEFLQRDVQLGRQVVQPGELRGLLTPELQACDRGGAFD